MITVDGRILDTDARWREWCEEHGIKDPFQEDDDHIKIKRKIVNGVECWEFRPVEQAWEEENYDRIIEWAVQEGFDITRYEIKE